MKGDKDEAEGGEREVLVKGRKKGRHRKEGRGERGRLLVLKERKGGKCEEEGGKAETVRGEREGRKE